MTAPRARPSGRTLRRPGPRIVEELFETLAEIKRSSGGAIVMAEQNVGYATAVADH